MAKSDAPFRHIERSRIYQGVRKAKFTTKPICGFDTETADGNIFAITIAPEGYGSYIKAEKSFLSPDEIFDLVTNERAAKSINVWYNLNFDANVILNHLLTENELSELTVTGRIELENHQITFIPSKFMQIRSGHKTYMHYDISQFFYGGLENAAEEWLGKDKLVDIADTTRFGSNDTNDYVNEYINDHWNEITKYALKDAELVKDLWREAINIGENSLEIPMGKPFSTGFLAESYLNHHLGHKPGIVNTEISSLAWQAYAGGRFEVLKRGFIGKVSGPDINSAYPYVLQQLPDPKSLQWKRFDDPSYENMKNCKCGFIDVTVTTDKNRLIQPFAVKQDKVVSFPALNKYRIQTISDIFVHALENGYITDYEIHNSWLGYSDQYTEYPFQFVDGLYKERKQFEKSGEMKKGQLLKIILNSMYGKTCQTTPKIRELSDDDTLESDDYMEEHVTNMELPEQLKKRYGDGFVKWLQCGAWFNPILASYITGLTRLELHKRILEYDLEEHTVMLATDSLMIEQEAFDKSNFAHDLVKDGLGNWDYDYTGTAFVIGAGVYEIELENNTIKTKTRGFNENDLNEQFGTLRNAAIEANGHISIESSRPRTFAEAIWMNEDLDVVGVFDTFTKKLTPDFDKKRNWDNQPGFADLLRDAEGSRPLTVGP